MIDAQRSVQPLYDAVYAGFAPFKLYDVRIYHQERIDLGSTLIVEVLFHDDSAYYRIVVNQSTIMWAEYDPVEEMWIQQLFNTMRYRKAIEVDDHVVLGEN